MRIVGGACKRRSLKVPSGGVRPTRGMIRAAVFNVLGDRITDSDVLDIFAGSGALGIEALSRGARHCTFIEKNPRVLRANIAGLALRDRATVLAADFRPALRRLKDRRFGIIFADPPYRMRYLQPALEMIARQGMLAQDGLIVAEHAPHEEFVVPEGLSVARQKKYGNTTISYVEHRKH